MVSLLRLKLNDTGRICLGAVLALWSGAAGAASVQAIIPGEDLPGIGVVGATVGEQGRIWAATNSGVYTWDGIDVEQVRDEGVRSIQLRRGVVWGVERGGRLVGGPSPVGSSVRAVAAGGDAVWVATEEGLYRRKGFKRGWELVLNEPVSAVVDAGARTVLAATPGELVRVTAGMPAELVRRGRAKYLAAAPSGEAVALIDGEVWREKIDASCRAPGSRHEPEDRWQGDEWVRAVAAGADGDVWVGTADGLWVCRRGRLKLEYEAAVYSIAREGSVLLLGTADGIKSLRLTGEFYVKASALKVGERILALEATDRATLWIGGWGGAGEWDPISGHIARVPELEGRRVTAVYEHAGAVWFGTFDGQLYRTGEGGAIELVADDLGGVVVITAHGDSLWVATYEAGVIEIAGNGTVGRHLSGAVPVWSVAAREGEVLAAIGTDGVWRYAGQEWAAVGPRPLAVRQIGWRHGEAWVGTADGQVAPLASVTSGGEQGGRPVLSWLSDGTCWWIGSRTVWRACGAARWEEQSWPAEGGQSTGASARLGEELYFGDDAGGVAVFSTSKEPSGEITHWNLRRAERWEAVATGTQEPAKFREGETAIFRLGSSRSAFSRGAADYEYALNGGSWMATREGGRFDVEITTDLRSVSVRAGPGGVERKLGLQVEREGLGPTRIWLRFLLVLGLPILGSVLFVGIRSSLRMRRVRRELLEMIREEGEEEQFEMLLEEELEQQNWRDETVGLTLYLVRPRGVGWKHREDAMLLELPEENRRLALVATPERSRWGGARVALLHRAKGSAGNDPMIVAEEISERLGRGWAVGFLSFVGRCGLTAEELRLAGGGVLTMGAIREKAGSRPIAGFRIAADGAMWFQLVRERTNTKGDVLTWRDENGKET